MCGTLAHPDRELRRRKINFDLSDIHAQREDPTPQTISSSFLMLDVQWLAHKAAKSAGMSIYQARCPTCGKLRELVPFDSKKNVCLRLFIAQRYDRFVVCVCVSPSPFIFFISAGSWRQECVWKSAALFSFTPLGRPSQPESCQRYVALTFSLTVCSSLAHAHSCCCCVLHTLKRTLKRWR